MLSTRFNRWTVAALALAAATAPGAVCAQTPDHPSDNSAQFPTRNDLRSLTTSGSYLAARHASVERDANSASAFYLSALRTDPKNNELLDRAFISSVADGRVYVALANSANKPVTLTKPAPGSAIHTTGGFWAALDAATTSCPSLAARRLRSLSSRSGLRLTR